MTYSQRSLVSFGPITELNLGFRPIGVAAGYSSTAVAEVAVVAHEQQAIQFYELSTDGSFNLTNKIRSTKPQRFIEAVDLNGDRRSEYITLSADGRTISIHKWSEGGFDVTLIPLQTASQRFVVADVDNNRRRDILLFGKGRAGVTVLRGRADGSFEQGPTLFTDISVSDLKTTDLNGDGITDIVLASWLSNQLVVFYGITRLIFSEQVTIDLQDEPVEVDLTDVTRQRTFRVAVSLPDAKRIDVYSGNALGEFHRLAGVHTPSRLSGVRLVDVNGDDTYDLLAGTGQGILVALGVTESEFSEPALFGCASSITGWTVADVDGDNRPDLVLVDRNSRKLIGLGNARYSGQVNWPSEYCVGNSPHGLAVRDFNGDGLPDIAVSNSKSATISILFNEGDGRMGGQQVVSIAENPTFVRAASSTRSPWKTLVASHPTVDKLTVIRLADDVSQSSAFTIPSGSDPYVVLASEDSPTQRLALLVRYRSLRDGSLSLSFFEQLNGGQFIERSLRPIFPHTITALTIDDLARNGGFDPIFSTHERKSGLSTVFRGIAESGFDFKVTQPLFSYPDSTSSTRMILTARVDTDDFRDIVISLGPPKNSMFVAYSRSDGTFLDSLVWIRDVSPISDDAVAIQDVNNDGRTDITFIDGNRKRVVTLFGTDQRGFRSPVTIANAEGVRSLRVASIRQPPLQDLILSNSDRGIVSILYNPFRR